MEEISMNDILSIFDEIANTSSRNGKEELLNQFRDCELFKEILKFVYNKFIITGISSKKISKNIKNCPVVVELEDIEQMMNYIQNYNTGRDFDIAVVQYFIAHQPENQRELITQILTKSLKLGIDSKTLNKIYSADSDFVPQFDVMLADKYFAHPEAVKGQFICTTKLDGIRCVILKENGEINIFSRQGQPIEGLVEILEDSKQLFDNYVYDGELILENVNGLASKDLYRETVKVARKDGIKRNLILNCFDMLPIDEFKKGKCKTPFYARKNALKMMLDCSSMKHIIEVPVLYQGRDKEQIIKLLDEAIAKGQEGIMINLSEAPYSCKRTKDILKVKKMQDCDCKITGFEEGEGRNKGKLGAIIIDYKGNSVKVGGGYSDVLREVIWHNKDGLLGKIIQVQFFEESSNSKNDELSLRFPVFMDFREDKTEPSYY